jgi:hypothetical protein
LAPLVRRLIRDKQARIAENAVAALGEVGDEQDVDALLAILEQPDRQFSVPGLRTPVSIHEAARCALTSITGQYLGQDVAAFKSWWRQNREQFSTIDSLRERLRSGNYHDIERALVRVRARRQREVIPEVWALMADERLRTFVPYDLVELGDWRAIPHLIERLSSSQPGAINLALTQLRRATGQCFYCDEAKWYRWYADAFRATAKPD